MKVEEEHAGLLQVYRRRDRGINFNVQTQHDNSTSLCSIEWHVGLC